MLQATFRPIATWPGKQAPYRKRSTFRAGYTNTLDRLEHELDRLRAKDVIIQVALESREIRNDGYPRSDARPRHPGVILTFQSAKGPLSFPCDKFDAWEDNLRAIALSLEALRTVDRYGVTQHAEQYKGWAQLHSGMTLEAAAQIIERGAMVVAGSAWLKILSHPEDFRAYYRAAVLKTHPDANNQPDALPGWHRLQAAADLLKAHHGIS